MWFKFRFAYFFAAFLVGIVFCQLLAPPSEIVIKFPSPYNAGSVVYKHDDGCFKYDATKVECPIDRSLIKPQPLPHLQQGVAMT
jgi:hypothetical protein